MVDTRIIMQAAQQPDINLPDILQRSAESAAAIEQIPLLQRQQQAQTVAIEQSQQASEQARQQQDAIRKSSVIYNYANQLKNLPMAQRRTFLSSIPEETIQDLGIDPQKIQSMAIDDASINTTIAQLAPIVESQREREQQAPADLQTFDALSKGLTEEEVQEAKRIKLGLGSKRKGTRNINIGGVEHVLDLDTGIAEPVRVGGQGITSETVADSESKIAGAKTKAVETQKDVQEFISQAAPKIAAIESNISTYDDVITAIDEGARTGNILSRLPSINEQSKDLDNLRIRLGLDVVSMATFGALSESEMRIALDSALPTTKEPQALREWVVNKQQSQRKAAEAMRDAVSFLDNGGTIGELISLGKNLKKNDSGSQSKPEEPQAQKPKRLKFNPETGLLE